MRVVNDVVCPGCACVCDDLTLKIEANQLCDISPPCPLAERWFRSNAAAIRSGEAVEISGQPASFDQGISRAAAILRDARYPLIYGLSRSSTPGQRAAIALADRLGAVIDTTASLCHGPSIVALQSVGESTSTLGEIRNRSDLVIFWGCNPAETHPRHAERYSVFPRGQFVPHGKSDRVVVMIGDEREVHSWRLDAAGSQPDIVIPVAPQRDFEAITTIRALLMGMRVDTDRVSETGASLSQLRMLVDKMKQCRSGVVFFGLGLTGTYFDRPNTESPLGHANVENLLRLVAELNGVTRFYARRMRLQGDVSGADSVLCWQTGFPFSVNLSRGFPRYNPGEYSANDLLDRGEVDACLMIGSETVVAFSPRAQDHLTKIPTIVLDYPNVTIPFTPSVHFTTASYGLHAAGTIYRMDETPLPLRSYLQSDLPTDDAVLKSIQATLHNVSRP